MTASIYMCGYCTQAAVWRWVPKSPPPAYHSLLCDDHAAKKDLDDLQELHEFWGAP